MSEPLKILVVTWEGYDEPTIEVFRNVPALVAAYGAEYKDAAMQAVREPGEEVVPNFPHGSEAKIRYLHVRE